MLKIQDINDNIHDVKSLDKYDLKKLAKKLYGSQHLLFLDKNGEVYDKKWLQFNADTD